MVLLTINTFMSNKTKLIYSQEQREAKASYGSLKLNCLREKSEIRLALRLRDPELPADPGRSSPAARPTTPGRARDLGPKPPGRGGAQDPASQDGRKSTDEETGPNVTCMSTQVADLPRKRRRHAKEKAS